MKLQLETEMLTRTLSQFCQYCQDSSINLVPWPDPCVASAPAAACSTRTAVFSNVLVLFSGSFLRTGYFCRYLHIFVIF